MAHLFGKRANLLSRLSVYGSVVALAIVMWLVPVLGRSGWVTGEGSAPEQPIDFRHDLHAGKLGLDCRLCHRAAESSAVAGLPDSATCMTCHQSVLPESEALRPLRESFEAEQPLRWTRVYDLPDFVRFDHSVHLIKGIGCVECHGRVDQMSVVRQDSPLTMEFCLDCHRHPEDRLRPRQSVFDLAWQSPPGAGSELGRSLAREYRVVGRDDCSACHQ